jgi:hypothetical protein
MEKNRIRDKLQIRNIIFLIPGVNWIRKDRKRSRIQVRNYGTVDVRNRAGHGPHQ